MRSLQQAGRYRSAMLVSAIRLQGVESGRRCPRALLEQVGETPLGLSGSLRTGTCRRILADRGHELAVLGLEQREEAALGRQPRNLDGVAEAPSPSRADRAP